MTSEGQIKKMDQRNHGEEGRVSKDYDKNADDTGGSEKPHDNFEQWSEQTQLKISKGCSGWPFIKELCSGKDRVKGKAWYSGLQKELSDFL